MKKPPHISPQKWASAGEAERKFWCQLHENAGLVREIRKILDVLPRDVVLDNYSAILCAVSSFDPTKAREMAYGIVLNAEKQLSREDG